MLLSTVHVQVESEGSNGFKVSCAGESSADQDVYVALRQLLKKLEDKDVFNAKSIPQPVKEEKKPDAGSNGPRRRDRQ